MNDIYKMTYNVFKKGKKIRILGEKFVARNKYKCHLIYRNKKMQLQKDISTKEIQNDEIKLKIIGLKSILDLSDLFQGCKTLVLFEKSLSQRKYYNNIKESEEEIQGEDFLNYNDIYNENSEEIKTTSNLALNYEQLLKKDSTEKLSLTLSNINEQMSFLFSDIDEAISIINKELNKTIINDAKIVNMSNMFFQCLSLKTIPDLSKINTENVIDISNMFYGCSSLTSLPDIKMENR